MGIITASSDHDGLDFTIEHVVLLQCFLHRPGYPDQVQIVSLNLVIDKSLNLTEWVLVRDIDRGDGIALWMGRLLLLMPGGIWGCVMLLIGTMDLVEYGDKEM